VITRGMSLHDNNDSLLSGDDDNALQDGSAGRTEDDELTDTDKSDSNNDDISNIVQQFRNIDMADIEDDDNQTQTGTDTAARFKRNQKEDPKLAIAIGQELQLVARNFR